MSSLRNAVKRITHKERSQPQSRAHLGLLEKKKDYKQRARDYHRKEDRIKVLRQKASMRNPDEFYFNMKNSIMVDGQHRKTEAALAKEREAEIGADAIRIMKDQDLAYVRMQRQKDAKKVEKLQASLHILQSDTVEPDSNRTKRKHTIFVETQSQADDFNVAKHFDTIPDLAGRAFNRPRIRDLRKAALETAGYGAEDDEAEDSQWTSTREQLRQEEKDAKKLARKIARARSAAYGELEARTKRMETLKVAEDHLLTEKNIASKGRKRKIKAAEGGKPAQYKWRRRRLG